MNKQKPRGFSSYCTTSVSRRTFLSGAIATGAMALAACNEQQSVQVTTTSTPTPLPSLSPTPAMPTLPPLAAKTYPANLNNAILAADEMIDHYAKVLDSPSTLIHAVRAFGKNFKRADGSNAVDFLCSHHAEEITVNGQKFIHFNRVSEFHENSFLKTFLEAGVAPEQAVTANGKNVTLKDVGENAKSLFRMDPNNLKKYVANYTQEHLPWGLIALATLMPGGNGTWVNVYGEKVVLLDIIDKALEEYDGVCQSLRTTIEHNDDVSVEFHTQINDYSCFGGHAVYAFLACLKNGYTDKNLKARIMTMLDSSIYRFAKESSAIEKQYAEAAKGPISPNPQEDAAITKGMERAGVTKAEVIDMATTRALIKLTGHLLEAINYAKLNQLFSPTPQQQKLIQVGEQKLFASIVKMRAFNTEGLKNFDPKQFGDVIIGLGHASRAMKLLSPNNPDKNPKAI